MPGTSRPYRCQYTPMNTSAWIAEILILRHQLAVLQRRQPRRPNLDWVDRALLATLLAVIPKARRQALRLLVTPEHGPALAPRQSDPADR